MILLAGLRDTDGTVREVSADQDTYERARAEVTGLLGPGEIVIWYRVP